MCSCLRKKVTKKQTPEEAEEDVELMLSKWNDMDELTLLGLLVLRNTINKEITVRKTNCAKCKNIPEKGCGHCYCKHERKFPPGMDPFDR